MKNKQVLIAFTALIALLAVNCNAQSSGALTGKWFFEDFLYGDELVVVEFTQNKMTVLLLEDDDTDTYSYRADSKTITIDDDDEFQYVVQNGNTLIMTDSYGDKYTGKKVRANAKTLSGKYEMVNDAGFIETLDFTDGSTVRGTGDAFGLSSFKFTAKYKISGSTVTISESTGGYGIIVLEIIGESILKGNTLGGFGDDSVFIKR